MDKSSGKTFVSAQQVADRAGVSRSAVSRTFTQGASVSPSTRQRVLAAAAELGYHVNHLARGLIHDRSNIVSLVGANIDTPHQSRMLTSLTRHLQNANKVAMVINTSGEATNSEAALRQTLHYRADATIVLSGQPDPSLIETCLANGQHVILINRDDPVPRPDSIVVSNRRSARAAFAMLQDAGCSRMAVVSSEVGSASLAARESAFVAAAHEAGTHVGVIRHGPTAYSSGAEAARHLLGRSSPPDGVFCVTDLLALGFMDAARHDFHLRIPNDLSVVGFDDIEQADWSSYQLTTFAQPVDAIAQYIVNLIDQPTRSDSVREPIRFEALPIWRSSVRKG